MTRDDQKAYLTQVLGPGVIGATFSIGGQTFQLPPDHMLLDVYSYGYQACALDEFLDRFGSAIPEIIPAPNPASGLYDALVALDPDNAQFWKVRFDRWHTDGLI